MYATAVVAKRVNTFRPLVNLAVNVNKFPLIHLNIVCRRRVMVSLLREKINFHSLACPIPRAREQTLE